MTLLITGAAGFIGSNFVKYCVNKYSNDKIIALDKLTYAGNMANLNAFLEDDQNNIEFIKGDICNRNLIEEVFAKYDLTTIINFAAESHVDRSIYNPQLFLETNILGTHVLLDVARNKWNTTKSSQREHVFVQISTDEVYGSLGPEGYFTEQDPLNPSSPYSSSKASADLIALSYYRTFDVPIIITRSSNNYGPYQFPEKLIPLMIDNVLHHKSLPVYGNGLQVRDWIYVVDHCRAIDSVVRYGNIGEVYNIGANNERTNISVVNQIIETVRDITNDDQITENLIKHVKDRPGHDRRYAIDSSKIEKEVGWAPTVDFEKGLTTTINWYIDNQDWVRDVKSGNYLRFYEMHYNEIE